MESILIALAGGALGILVAYAVLQILITLQPASLNTFDPPAIDKGVLAFTAAVAIFSGLLFGLVPAWQAGREDPLAILKLGLWRSSASRTRFRKVLVTGEIALTVVLLIGAGLLLRTMANMNKVPLGFETQGILSFSISPHGEPYTRRTHDICLSKPLRTYLRPSSYTSGSRFSRSH